MERSINILTEDSILYIPVSCFHICLIDEITKDEIIELYPSRIHGLII